MTFHFPYLHILNLKEKEKEQAYLEFGRTIRKKNLSKQNIKASNKNGMSFLHRWSQLKGRPRLPIYNNETSI